jgi:hypothetical protein
MKGATHEKHAEKAKTNALMIRIPGNQKVRAKYDVRDQGVCSNPPAISAY